MKVLTTLSLTVLAAIEFSGVVAHGQTEKAKDPAQDAVQAMTGKETKGGRRKKAAMCAECGKPESECECKGHKEKSENGRKEESAPKH